MDGPYVYSIIISRISFQCLIFEIVKMVFKQRGGNSKLKLFFQNRNKKGMNLPKCNFLIKKTSWFDKIMNWFASKGFFLTFMFLKEVNNRIIVKQIFCGHKQWKNHFSCNFCFLLQLLYLMSFGLELWWIIEAEGKLLFLSYVARLCSAHTPP